MAASIEMVFKAFKFRADAEFMFEEMIEMSLFAFKFIFPLFVAILLPCKFSLDREFISRLFFKPPKLDLVVWLVWELLNAVGVRSILSAFIAMLSFAVRFDPVILVSSFEVRLMSFAFRFELKTSSFRL